MMPRKTVAAGSGFRATQPSQIFAEPRMDRAPRFAQLFRPDGYWDFCLIGAHPPSGHRPTYDEPCARFEAGSCYLPPGQYRFTITTATAVYCSVAGVPIS
jgi:hypothetical protein